MREERQRRLRELQNPWSLDSYLQRQYQSNRNTQIPTNTLQTPVLQAAHLQIISRQIPTFQPQTSRGQYQIYQPQGTVRTIQPTTRDKVRQPNRSCHNKRQPLSHTTRTKKPQPSPHLNERKVQTNPSQTHSMSCKAGDTLPSQVQARHVESRERSEIIDIEEPCYDERDFNQGVLDLNDESGENSFQDGVLNLDESQVQSNILFEKHYTTLVKRLQRFF